MGAKAGLERLICSYASSQACKISGVEISCRQAPWIHEFSTPYFQDNADISTELFKRFYKGTLRHQGLFPKPLAHTLRILSAPIPSLQPLKIIFHRSLASAHMATHLATKSQDEASCSFSAPKSRGTLAVWSCLMSVWRMTWQSWTTWHGSDYSLGVSTLL